MAKKFLEGVNLKAQSSRNGFDTSYQNQFTAPFGMILPFFFQRVNPNDKVKLSNESQTICEGLVKPAFMRLKQHLDYYFIPATQLWMGFDNFITGQNSWFSTAVSDINSDFIPTEVPTFTGDYIYQCFDTLQFPSNAFTDDLGYDGIQGAIRLFDLLGYFNIGRAGTALNDGAVSELPIKRFEDVTQRFNLFPLLCYQKVYYDYFRNPKYEDNKVEAYNIDDLRSGLVIQDAGDMLITRMHDICKVHYRWQKRDYFTQTQPNILVQSGQIGYDGLSNSINWLNVFAVPGLTKTRESGTLVNAPNVQNSTSSFPINNGHYVNAGVLTSNTSNNTNAYMSVANIRFAFAYDRLLRRMREAGPDFDKQMLAQFGITPHDQRHGKCYYIGGYTNQLSASDVTNVTGENIGDLAGQINAYCDNSNNVLNYHVKEHGYIIGVYSTSVDNMYQSYRTSRETLLRNRFDWFNPAFENIGLQPVFSAERDYQDYQASRLGCDIDWTTFSSVAGYVPRYSELKTHTDECHGILCNYSQITGYKEWNVQVNLPINGRSPVLERGNMLLNPAQFDAVAGVDYNGTQPTDHFVINTYNHCHKVSNMSLFETF